MTLHRRRLFLSLTVLMLLALTEMVDRRVEAQSGCAAATNPITCENALAGSPPSEWDISGAGDSTIQGFATEISVVRGQTQRFKVDTTATAYTIDIYRMGYYGGMGARRVATLSQIPGQNQPSCMTDSTTGLVDCGNWAISASWVVPADAVSGIYFAKLTRSNGGASHIVFVVRDDSSRSDLLFQTSDTTWQAYNTYGGNSLYVGSPAGRAYKVSYNRPFDTRAHSPQDWVFNAEYPMVRFLEANGYNVSYFTGVDSHRLGGELLEHKIVLSVGHDEYWSGGQRAAFDAARAAGVHLAFFSGNSVFWKTRWEPSIDGSNTPHRTLVCYKETHANAKIDPSPEWTGTWRDPRFSPPADGGRPENELMGTIFMVNDGDTTAIEVPAAHGKTRFWRNTSVATLSDGQVATLAAQTLGYEWDADLNNGFRPSGLIALSETTKTVGGMLLDYGSTYGSGTVTHRLTLYRHPSGALVFGAGTVQWAWGLDVNHDRSGPTTPDVRMQQATVNLFADMGAQPDSLQSGLVAASPSLDTAAPTTTISSPAAGETIAVGTQVTITGTAADVGGVVAGVEVSFDGGTTWYRASGTTAWSYVWTASGTTSATIQSRGYDDSGNMEVPSSGVTVNLTGSGSCPCTMWSPSAVPAQPDDGDAAAVELGTKFRSDVNGYITAIRFYKASLNTGTHVGSLWTRTGTKLASVTFTNETASGWQQADLATPVAISANTTYVVSYHAPNGHYTGTDFFFTTSLDNGPLHGLQDGVDGPNGVYVYGQSAFPTNTYQSEGYWVDVVFVQEVGSDTTPPTVTAVSPPGGATGVSASTTVTATFSEAMDATTIFGGTGGTFELRDSLNQLVNAEVTYDTGTKIATLRPLATLALSSTYTATVRGGTTDPRVKDLAGNALAESVTWSFTTAATTGPTCPCTIWSPASVPAIVDSSDGNPVELGTRFRSDIAGYVTGVRFYKSLANTGTHVGRVWTSTGTLLGSVTFSNETSSGWQQANFATPVPIDANTTYVVSYHAPVGRYSFTSQFFATSGLDNPPLHAPQDGVYGANGVYLYGSGGFPVNTYQSAAYWVDVVFNTSVEPDTTAPTVIGTRPASGASGVTVDTAVSATFSEPMTASTITADTFELRDPANALIAGTVTYDSGSNTATLKPSAVLAYSTQYTARVKGGTADPRVKDTSGNALAADYIWSFTTAAPPPPPPTQGPGGPVLVVTSTSNAFSTYYAEILRNEGLNAFATLDLTEVTATTLAAYDVVILGNISLADAQVTMFSDWVTAGGRLIAMRPDKKLAPLLGLTDAGATLSNAYLLVNTATAPGAGIVNETMQFHGTADRYTLNGATALATLYASATASTTSPAVTMRQVGSGTAVAFAYDLARSVVYTRQGNPAWSGQERDGYAPIRPDDLFYGASAGDVRPDWVDLSKVYIPQADEQQRFLWNIILHTNASQRPLPRFWYLPRMLKAAVIMTGDDHGNNGTEQRFNSYVSRSPAGCSVDNWECIRSTSYMYPNTPMSDATAANFQSLGFELALHVNTNCANYTPSTLPGFYSTQLADFATRFPSVTAPATNRTHCIVFSDYDAQPQVELSHGIRLDTNYYYWPGDWILDRPGHFTGSGLPMRFATSSGQMVDVYQANTQMTDESGQDYQKHIDALLDRAIGPDGYVAVVTANMHTDYNPSEGSRGSDIIITAAQGRGVPVVSARQMLRWLDGRNASSFADITWNGSVLGFTIAVGAGAHGLHALVPATAGGTDIGGITVNGTAVPFTVQTIKGVSYAAFAAQAGSYQVSYGTTTTAPLVSIGDTSVTEGNSSNVDAVFQVTLSQAASTTSSVAYATSNGSAIAGEDYTAATGTLTFAAGETSKTINVAVLGDTASEADETFTVTLSNPVNLQIGDGVGVGTIVNDDSDPLPSLSIADVSLVEGDSGVVNATLPVTLSTASSSTVTVEFTTADLTATAGSDYVLTSGTLTFNPGITAQNIVVAVTGDTLNEAHEQFVVNLSNAVNATIADAQGIATIQNDDPLPSLSVADLTVTEGNTGTTSASVVVSLAPASGQTVTVSYTTADGTATAGSDYTAVSGTVTFLPGMTTQSVLVPIVGDTTAEANETLQVNLSAAVNATIADGQAIVTITNDDVASAPAGLVAAYSFNEGAGTAVTDASGSGNHGTVSGATWSAQGHTGYALSFDGVNDMVSIADSATLDVTRITMMAWVRPTTGTGWRTIMLKERSGGLAYGLYANDNRNRPSGYVRIGNADRSVQGPAGLSLNTWSHVAMTYDGANMRLYVNGVLVRTTARTGNIAVSSDPLRLGGNTVWGEYFAGLIDDVRLYNRALSDAEVQADMNTPVP